MSFLFEPKHAHDCADLSCDRSCIHASHGERQLRQIGFLKWLRRASGLPLMLGALLAQRMLVAFLVWFDVECACNYADIMRSEIDALGERAEKQWRMRR